MEWLTGLDAEGFMARQLISPFPLVKNYEVLLAHLPNEDETKQLWAWCLWCLFWAKIGANYAKGLKRLQKTRAQKSPMFMRFSCKLLKAWQDNKSGQVSIPPSPPE